MPANRRMMGAAAGMFNQDSTQEIRDWRAMSKDENTCGDPSKAMTKDRGKAGIRNAFTRSM